MVSFGSFRPFALTYSLAAATARSATGSCATAGDAIERPTHNAAERSSLIPRPPCKARFRIPLQRYSRCSFLAFDCLGVQHGSKKRSSWRALSVPALNEGIEHAIVGDGLFRASPRLNYGS